MTALSIFKKNIERAETIFNAHRNAFKRGRPPEDWTSDLLRTALVFAVASFDAYMHDKITEILPLFIRKYRLNLPGNFVEILKQSMTYEKLLQIFWEERPQEHFRTAIKKFYEERTIQDVGDIEKVAKMLGISDFWFELASKINKRRGRIKKLTKESVKKYIQPFVERRHKIVHEADLYTSKKHRATLRKIKVDFVEDGIKKIRLFTEGIDHLINEYLKT